MSHTVINPITKEEIDDRTQFVITEGRYYAFMFFISLPHHLSKFGQGGDINGLLWKLNEEPNKWTFQFRFRHYKDVPAFDSDDEKSWYAVEITADTEDKAREEVDEVLEIMLDLGQDFKADLKIHRLEIKGDNLKFLEVVQEQKPFWMHTQQIRQE